MNKKDWLDELKKYDVVRIPNLYDYEDYIFKSAQTSYCYLAAFHGKYADLAERIYFGKQNCKIQYYSSRQYNMRNKKDFGRYARHLKTLKRQLDRAIYEKKNYLMEYKLKKMDKDF